MTRNHQFFQFLLLYCQYLTINIVLVFCFIPLFSTCVVFHFQISEAVLRREVKKEVEYTGSGQHTLEAAVHKTGVAQVPNKKI